MKAYDHKKIEKKWQKEWEKSGIFHAEDPAKDGASSSKKPKYYSLIEFPYPSGAGMHVGHIRSNTAMDIISRKRRMEGFNVLYPIGWDAFGLPTENYAIKTGRPPAEIANENIDTFRRQLQALGFSFDWSREINTTDPKYYKWTQWIFLQFFKKGLAYKARTLINWCPKDKIGLANEEVVTRSTSSGQVGCCERCGSPTEKREKEQWMLAITKYADRLDKDLDTVDYLEKIKIQQRNWIGKSEGAEIKFSISNSQFSIDVFTTRPDTIFGATFLALSPEVAKKITGKDFGIKLDTDKENKPARHADASHAGGEKIGIDTGLKAKNPANGEMIPVFAVNYVSAEYGTGAIMGVPAHDERDFEFAKKYGLEVKNVPLADKETIEKIGGKWVTKYKLRDWVFSRQRYWGEPIPLIYCENCAHQNGGQGWVPVPEKDLPVVLPKVAKYKPTDNGESPLADMKSWVNVKCPKCKGPATRETDTMPNWAGSSWYYLAYCMGKKGFNGSATFENWKLQIENFRHFMPVDWYNGGMEHTTLHLLYSRFWHKFLYDLKLVPTSEPYMKRTSHGMILAAEGEKMSKSKGNVVNPDDLIKTYGADTLRTYEMFMGPFDQAVSWSSDSLIGPRRFLEKVWRIGEKVLKQKNFSGLLQPKAGTFPVQNSSILKLLNKTIKKVSEDIEAMHFNTAISAMMILATEMEKAEDINLEDYKKFLQLLSPFAPHITEELWKILGHKKSISHESWPIYDLSKVKEDEIKIVIQVNGKMRAEMMIKLDESEESVKEKALKDSIVLKYIAGKEIKKLIYVKNRLINIVV